MGKSSKRRRRAGSHVLYSGAILGAVVDALDVGEGALAGKTAKRMFSGRSVSESGRKDVLTALGQVMVDSGLVPDLDARLRERPFREGLTTSDMVGDVIGMICVRWDMLMRSMVDRSARIADVSGAGRRFLRLAVVDIALRMIGFAHFAGVDLREPKVPVWAKPNGVGEVLRAHLREAGLTRYQLAMGVGVSPTTVDNWLDGRNAPGRSYLPGLAKQLSQTRAVSTSDLEVELRRQFALARLAERVAGGVGWEAVGADAEAALRFAKLMQEGDVMGWLLEQLSGVKRSKEVNLWGNPGLLSDVLLPMVLVMGSGAPFAGALLAWLAERPEVSGWSDDIYAVAGSPELEAEYIAYEHSGENEYIGLVQDYFDVVGEPSREDLEVRAALRRVAEEQLDAAPSFKLEADDVKYTFERYMGLPGPVRELVRRYPGSAEADYHLGSLLSLMGLRLGADALLDEGIRECRVASGLEPRWDAPAVAPAVTLCNLDDWEGALLELEKAESTLPEATPGLRLVRGYALMNVERYEEALVDYLAVAEMRPDFPAVWEGAAHCALSLGDRTRGLDFAKKARALGEPRVYDAWDKGAYGRRRKK